MTENNKQQIREPNYMYELSLIDKELVKLKQNGFQIGFSVGFHIFQKMRYEHGTPRLMEVMANIVSFLTNTKFITAFVENDIEVLDFYWFNCNDLTQEFYKLVVDRINLLNS